MELAPKPQPLPPSENTDPPYGYRGQNPSDSLSSRDAHVAYLSHPVPSATPPAYSPPNTDPYFIHMPIESLLSALHNNSRLLGLSCLYPLPRQSAPASIDLPLSLHPVELQMEIYHLPYIDCIPIPYLRHNLILFNEVIDNESFCLDLVGSSSFIITGSQSWEPSGWVICEEFKAKWAILFS